MAVESPSLKPLTDAIEDVEVLASQLVLFCKEAGRRLPAELEVAVERLAVALWELQETRIRTSALALEIGTPPLRVVGASAAR